MLCRTKPQKSIANLLPKSQIGWPIWLAVSDSSKSAKLESSCFIVRTTMIVELTPGRLWTQDQRDGRDGAVQFLRDLLQFVDDVVNLTGK